MASNSMFLGLLIGIASVAVWVVVRYWLLPPIRGQGRSGAGAPAKDNEKTGALRRRMFVGIALLWFWVLGLVFISGGMTVGNNRNVLAFLLAITGITMVATFMTRRRM